MKKAKTEKDEEPDPNLRVLECMKSNYGPLGETIMLRWKEGLFLPAEAMGSLDKMAVEQKTDQTFLDLLDRFNRQGRNLSEKPNAPSYAPTLFSKDPQAKGRLSQGGIRGRNAPPICGQQNSRRKPWTTVARSLAADFGRQK